MDIKVGVGEELAVQLVEEIPAVRVSCELLAAAYKVIQNDHPDHSLLIELDKALKA